ncbi:MAG: hypothetical protein ACRD5H_18800, partial [Nitrososphaerales archaeon]
LCGRCALSMFKDKSDVVFYCTQYPIIGRFIAEMRLTGGHGWVRRDSNRSHHSWWVPTNVCPSNFCHEIEPVVT